MFIINPYLFGGSHPVTITDQSITVVETGGSTATAIYKVNNDRNIYKNAITLVEAWLSGAAAVADYEVRATLVTGDPGFPTGSALSSWLSCSTNRAWTVTATAGQTKSATLTIEIRDVATSTVRDSATIVLTAEAAAGDPPGDPIPPPGGGGGGHQN